MKWLKAIAAAVTVSFTVAACAGPGILNAVQITDAVGKQFIETVAMYKSLRAGGFITAGEYADFAKFGAKFKVLYPELSKNVERIAECQVRAVTDPTLDCGSPAETIKLLLDLKNQLLMFYLAALAKGGK